jgi:hypothetical protein
MNVANAQTFPNTQDNTTAAPSPPSTLQQEPSQPKLHLVKITSPSKGQQVPVAKGLIISGTSADNATTSNCGVSVIVNGIKPEISNPILQALQQTYTLAVMAVVAAVAMYIEI